jgi:DNA-binding beta-propeller fold protein YncE
MPQQSQGFNPMSSILSSTTLNLRRAARFAPVAALLAGFAFGSTAYGARAAAANRTTGERNYLYVASPSLARQLERGGHGILVFDIDDGHTFVKRLPAAGLNPETGLPLSLKGIVASAETNRLWVSSMQTLFCLDLLTEQILWERRYEGGCDRMAVSPDGKIIYLPTVEKDHWHVIDALTGDIIKALEVRSGAHNTIFSPTGKRVYLAGLHSPMLNIADARTHTLLKPVGPFSSVIRPFTINSEETLCFVNVNGLLGFEVGDLRTGRMIHRVEVPGYKQGPVKRHKCPSHGVALTPDEREVWVVDAHNQRIHIFDITRMNARTPPRMVDSIRLERDEPGWITFSIDGRYAYPSSGEIIDAKTRKIVTALVDEEGRAVMSEKVMQIVFRDGRPVRTGDQFGIGRKSTAGWPASIASQ